MKTRSAAIAMTLAAAVTLLMCAGCRREKGDMSQTYVTDGGDAPSISAAVLPFDSPTSSPDAAQTATAQVVTALLATRAVDVLEPGLVNQVVAELRIARSTEELDQSRIQKLREALKVDVLVVGRVNESEDVSSGTESYPALSVTVRMLDAWSGRILWSDSRTKIGAGKFFGVGRVSSKAALSQAIIKDMTDAVARDAGRIIAAVEHSREAAARAERSEKLTGAETPRRTGPTTAEGASSGGSAPASPSTPSAAGAAVSSTEPVLNGELKALLVEVEGLRRSDPQFISVSFHPRVTADYYVDDKCVTATVVDYLEDGQPEKFVKPDHGEDSQPTDFRGYPSYRRTSSDGYAHLDVLVGRFAVRLESAPDLASHADRIAEAVIEAIEGKKLVARSG